MALKFHPPAYVNSCVIYSKVQVGSHVNSSCDLNCDCVYSPQNAVMRGMPMRKEWVRFAWNGIEISSSSLRVPISSYVKMGSHVNSSCDVNCDCV